MNTFAANRCAYRTRSHCGFRGCVIAASHPEGDQILQGDLPVFLENTKACFWRLSRMTDACLGCEGFDFIDQAR
jgi:hypothetical protein